MLIKYSETFLPTSSRVRLKLKRIDEIREADQETQLFLRIVPSSRTPDLTSNDQAWLAPPSLVLPFQLPDSKCHEMVSVVCEKRYRVQTIASPTAIRLSIKVVVADGRSPWKWSNGSMRSTVSSDEHAVFPFAICFEKGSLSVKHLSSNLRQSMFSFPRCVHVLRSPVVKPCWRSSIIPPDHHAIFPRYVASEIANARVIDVGR